MPTPVRFNPFAGIRRALDMGISAADEERRKDERMREMLMLKGVDPTKLGEDTSATARFFGGPKKRIDLGMATTALEAQRQRLLDEALSSRTKERGIIRGEQKAEKLAERDTTDFLAKQKKREYAAGLLKHAESLGFQKDVEPGLKYKASDATEYLDAGIMAAKQFLEERGELQALNKLLAAKGIAPPEGEPSYTKTAKAISSKETEKEDKETRSKTIELLSRTGRYTPQDLKGMTTEQLQSARVIEEGRPAPPSEKGRSGFSALTDQMVITKELADKASIDAAAILDSEKATPEQKAKALAMEKQTNLELSGKVISLITNYNSFIRDGRMPETEAESLRQETWYGLENAFGGADDAKQGLMRGSKEERFTDTWNALGTPGQFSNWAKQFTGQKDMMAALKTLTYKLETFDKPLMSWIFKMDADPVVLRYLLPMMIKMEEDKQSKKGAAR